MTCPYLLAPVRLRSKTSITSVIEHSFFACDLVSVLVRQPLKSGSFGSNWSLRLQVVLLSSQFANVRERISCTALSEGRHLCRRIHRFPQSFGVGSENETVEVGEL